MLVCKLEVIETWEKFRKLDYQSTNWMLYICILKIFREFKNGRTIRD